MPRPDTALLAEGARYHINLTRPESSSSSESLEGTIVRVTDDDVVLVDAVTTARNESATPILKDVPYIGKRYFRSVGVGIDDHGAKEIRVPLAEIASFELIDRS